MFLNRPALAAEQARLAKIVAVHRRHIEAAQRAAERLAADAVEATEDGGLRDTYDEDSESDAAVAAGLVRQTAERAMHAYRRVAELEAKGRALAFGYTTDDNGDTLAVGRLSVIDGDDTLLVDWRAPAAVPFYQATPIDRLGVRQRRQYHYGDGISTNANELLDFSDEVFDLDGLSADTALRGEAALLAAVSAPTNEQMRSVVATIQAEQDAIIRASADGPLVVQGGPGTGKTVVALHRAAYLLYEQRAHLVDTGVLVVGPTTEFLRYIREVLPSLGETGVVSVTAAKLFPGVLLGLVDAPDVAEFKGRAEMAAFLAAALADRRRTPTEPLVTWYGSRRVTLPTDQLVRIFKRATGYSSHNEGSFAFSELIIDALADQVYDPAFPGGDAHDSFRHSLDVRRFLLRHWPELTPEQALNDLFGSRALLRSAARAAGMVVEQAEQMFRPRTPEADLDGIRWSEADIPLLDELLYLVGGAEVGEIDQRDLERDEADEFEVARDAASEAADQQDNEVAGASHARPADPLLSDLGGAGEADLLLEDPVFGRRVWFSDDEAGGLPTTLEQDLDAFDRDRAASELDGAPASRGDADVGDGSDESGHSEAGPTPGWWRGDVG